MYYVILGRVLSGPFDSEAAANAEADKIALNGQGDAIVAKAVSVSVLDKKALRKPLEDANG